MDGSTELQHTVAPHGDMKWVELFLCATFCVVVFIIPENVAFAESIVFGYIFLLLQMAALPLLNGHKRILLCSTVFVIVVPTSQFLSCIASEYTKDMAVMYGFAYVVKELILYLTIRAGVLQRPRSPKSYDKSIAVALLAWATIGCFVHYVIPDDPSQITVYAKILHILHYTPLFFMLHVNVVSRTDEGSNTRTDCAGFM